jgi:lipid-A-disaccharide synthase
LKYFLIAGEASGDLHGAALMNALKKEDSNAQFHFFGGDRMASEGGVLLKHYREMAFMGAIEVLMNLRVIRRNMELCKQEIRKVKPDVVILIDYPGFNMKIAEFAHQHKFKVYWYIAPKVWAWKEWRIASLKSYVDELFTILPFETSYFHKHNLEVHYVGNPLLDTILESKGKFRPSAQFQVDNHLDDRPIVALLPGSRAQEIRYMLPVMSKLASLYPGYQFVVSKADALDEEIYRKYSDHKTLKLLSGQTYELVYHSRAALVASGTATLETALLDTPQAVLYKMAGGGLSYRIFQWLFLKVRYISLPNLILGKEAVKEFVMDQMNLEAVRPELERLLNDESYRREILAEYERLHTLMGEPGAAGRAAREMFRLLRS